MLVKEYKNRFNLFAIIFCLACTIIVLLFIFGMMDNQNMFLMSLFVLACGYFSGKEIIKKVEINDNKLIVTYIFGIDKIELKEINKIEENIKQTIVPPRYYKVLNILLKNGEMKYYGIKELPKEIKEYLINKFK
jgi:hypothetical protein